jgi:ferrochelatase
LVQDFETRYRLVGHSPLIEITKDQASHLQERLGDGYIVRAGMRHSEPFIESAVADCRAAGATSLKGIILSPQFSSFIMEGYKTAFMEAAGKYDIDESCAVVAGPWETESHFIELLANRVEHSLKELQKEYGISVPVIFTAHSLPQRVVKKDPSYLRQLKNTIDAVRERLDPKIEWYAGYQSAGHTPEEWLKPDLVDILIDLHKKETSAVLIVPIQFLADHLEILYDLDIAAREQCQEFNITYHRIELPNTDPLFIQALASVVK